MNSQEHLDSLSEIRNLMERSSRFISLSGLAGIFAGTVALVGAGIAISHFNFDILRDAPLAQNYSGEVMSLTPPNRLATSSNPLPFVIADALIVLVLSLAGGVYFTTRKARKKGLSIWDATAIRLLINLFIPLAAGGIFCLILIYHNIFYLVAPATLVFYGLALINASKYTLNDIRYLGVTEIILGLIAALYVGYGLLFWMLGFGVMHIAYGAVMYWKYER